MNSLDLFASGLKAKASECEKYSRNLTRVNGGDETDETKELDLRALILRDVANIADEVSRIK